ENTNLPSMATKAAAAIAPSVVRVMGYGLDKGDDEEKEKDKEKGKGDDKSKDAAKDKDKDAAKDKAKSVAKDKDKAAAKDKLARNDGGVQKAPEPKAKEPAKDKEPSKDADKDKDPKSARNDGGFPGYRSTGIGTGVVIVDKGIILTNLHVVLGAEKIKVRFFDGMEAEATVIG